MHWGDDVLLLYLAPFFKPHLPKCGNPTLGVKANQSTPECSSSKAVEFSAEWLRIWRYERGISHRAGVHHLLKCQATLCELSIPCIHKHFNYRSKVACPFSHILRSGYLLRSRLLIIPVYTERQKKHNFFRATPTKIHTKVNHIWTQISYITP